MPERRDITVSIDARKGMDAPATMQVRTVFHGPGAERVRAQFASDGAAAMQEAYRDYYGSVEHRTCKSCGHVMPTPDDRSFEEQNPVQGR